MTPDTETVQGAKEMFDVIRFVLWNKCNGLVSVWLQTWRSV